MKKNLAKKIISISVVAVVLALVITTIVLAIVPKKFSNPIQDGYATITIYKDGLAQQYTYSENPVTEADKEHNAVYTTIRDLHEKSLKDSVLSALFQGTGSFNVDVNNFSTINAISTVAKEVDNALVFTYMEKQVLKIDGEVYKDVGTLSSKEVEFDMIVMPLGDTKNFDQCKVYLCDKSNNECEYSLTFLAHQADLNNYIEGIEFVVIG
ncbi:MAG: hypothetical protein IJW59_00430 [Clostridia bacterium]|nr:hypothetical protein [Clostridia bacterium]